MILLVQAYQIVLRIFMEIPLVFFIIILLVRLIEMARLSAILYFRVMDHPTVCPSVRPSWSNLFNAVSSYYINVLNPLLGLALCHFEFSSATGNMSSRLFPDQQQVVRYLIYKGT